MCFGQSAAILSVVNNHHSGLRTLEPCGAKHPLSPIIIITNKRTETHISNIAGIVNIKVRETEKSLV